MASNVAQGLYTIKIPSVSRLVRNHGTKNKELTTKAASASSSEKKRIVRDIKLWWSSTYTTDVIEWRICAYPTGDDLYMYLHLLPTNSAVIDKFGYVNLLHDNSSDGSWMIRGNRRPGEEIPSEPGNFGKILEIPFEKGHLGNILDLQMVGVGKFDNVCRERASRDDCLDMKLAVWFNILDPVRDLRSLVLTGETSMGRK